MSSRQQRAEYGSFGATRKLSVSIPTGLIEIAEQLATEASKQPGWQGPPTTRSGQIAEMMTQGLARINEQRQKDGKAPLIYEHTFRSQGRGY